MEEATDAKCLDAPEVLTRPSIVVSMVVDLAVNSRHAVKELSATLLFAEGMAAVRDVSIQTAQRELELVLIIAYLMVVTTRALSRAAHVPLSIPLLIAGSTTLTSGRWRTRKSWL